ncbi:DNA mismatch repair endonuclease MutL [Peptostreptococcus faecalis]|uniref:DNA mismatch repair endonuclease MutL n=1 Tax=Peptostreptococcus faecalis TaxID=2045015 RepID=UPI000C7BDBEB|nr:DNA mismatch repair endonuclease MutL [Peptostreptococcus faecalis]
MSKINVLSESTINKIAAGEVIERPSSIIKELVENSIDAGSSTISIEIVNGGKDLIKIIDNGSGIHPDDVNKAFMRHATSKIQRVEDLSYLSSLGFRGEALASIAAVSKLDMITKTNDEMMGTKIIINGGKIVSKEPVACNNGTIISVNELFYNTPARKKFLKSNHSETIAITDLLNKLCLGNSNIKFKYINNGKTVFETIGDGSLSNAIRLIYGKDVSDNLIKLDYVSEHFKIDGFMANNNIYRSNRNLQHIYINGRYIKSSNIMNIINDSYKSIIPINKFPVYFINLSIDPSTIDVNIHPNKLEVRFDKEEQILSDLSDYIRGLLLKNSLVGKYKPSFTKKDDLYQSKNEYKVFDSFSYSKNEQEADLKDSKEFVSHDKVKEDNINSYDSHCHDSSKNTPKEFKELEVVEKIRINEQINNENKIKKFTAIGELKSNNIDNSLENHYDDSNLTKETINTKSTYDDKSQMTLFEESARDNSFKNLKYVGIVFDTYILFSKGDKMIMMDQHAAHERVQFEMYMNKFKSDSVSIQMLIDPIVMQLNPSDMLTVSKKTEEFKKFGFIIEEYGYKDISIRGVPNTFGYPESERFVLELIDNFNKIDNIYETKYDDIAEIACKSAIKANDKISYEESLELVNQLEKCENPYTCPHGRPIMVSMTKYDIEKMFKRKM